MRTLRLPFLTSALIASVGLSATVQAADLPRRTVVAPAPFVPVPVFTWTGFYVGANAGWGFSDNNTDNSALLGGNGLFVPAFPTGALPPRNFTEGTTALLDPTRRRTDAFVGGRQIGYNYQFTPGTGFVIGAEADIQGLTVTHIFLLWAKDLISLADPAALGGRARERTCSMKPVIGPRPSSGRPTLGMQDAPTVS